MNRNVKLTAIAAVSVGSVLLVGAPAMAYSPADNAANDPSKVAEHLAMLEELGYDESDSSTLVLPKEEEGTVSPNAIRFDNGRLSAQAFSDVSDYHAVGEGEIVTGFVSEATFGNAGIGVTVDGDTFSNWLGSSPANPTSTQLVSDISAAGAFSGSVGNAGGSVNIEGNHVLITTNTSGASLTNQGYQGVSLNGPIISVSQASRANFLFGATDLGVTAE